ncbi:MAG: NAD-dependent epimerase/dehydratase family protein [Candidatus Alcyoniella australis]|nr:NAD-dependent epimerase/dehydratase family protein [Candidatus Alcyoniella australis]
MIVALTGATGFLGASLVRELLERGHEVRALQRETSDNQFIYGLPIELRTIDLFDVDSLQRAFEGAQAVIHAAAEVPRSGHHTSRVMSVARDGTYNVLQACRRARVQRMVHVSTICTIGPGTIDHPACEGTPRPKWLDSIVYFRTKHMAELEVRGAMEAGLDAVIVNPAAMIGPYDSKLTTGRLISEIRNSKLTYGVPGGSCFADVADVAAGIVSAMQSGRKGESYILGGENIGFIDAMRRIADTVGGTAPEKMISARALLTGSRVLSLLGRSPVLSIDEMRIVAHEMYYCCDKAREELGYDCRPFEQSVARADQWYRENKIY